MRQVEVDLMRYLPKFLAKSATFKSTQDTLSWEHEQYRLKIVETAKQFFLETATWGLSDWERFLGITPKEDSSFEARKAYCRVKVRGAQTMTPENTVRLMQEFFVSGQAGVEELGDDEIRLVLDDGVFYWEELFKALWEYLPAHLEWSLSFNRQFDWTMYAGFAQTSAGSQNVDNTPAPASKVRLAVNHNVTDFDNSLISYDENTLPRQMNVNVGHFAGFGGYVAIAAEPDDDDFDGELYRIIWENWQRWKHNPVVRQYGHNFDFDEGELEGGDEPEYYPDGDFLRLYFGFGRSKRYRYLTLTNPRKELEANEIKEVGNYAAATKAVVSRNGWASTGITRALYVERKTAKIF